jgi:hypothetical protein
MAAKDITDALQNPHPAVPFSHVGDDTIKALAELASIFKLKVQQTSPPTLPAAPPTIKQCTCLAESSNPILASPMPPPRQTRSQTTIHTHEVTNAPLLPRVVTPGTLNPSPPRVPTRSQSLAPRNLSQNDFCGMNTAHMAIALGNNHWSHQHQANAIIHQFTRKEMEYMALMKDLPSTTTLERRLWQRMRMPVPRHSRNSWNRHMFLYQTHQHPKRQKDHLRQNSLRLQTSQ